MHVRIYIQSLHLFRLPQSIDYSVGKHQARPHEESNSPLHLFNGLGVINQRTGPLLVKTLFRGIIQVYKAHKTLYTCMLHIKPCQILIVSMHVANLVHKKLTHLTHSMLSQT